MSETMMMVRAGRAKWSVLVFCAGIALVFFACNLDKLIGPKTDPASQPTINISATRTTAKFGETFDPAVTVAPPTGITGTLDTSQYTIELVTSGALAVDATTKTGVY